MKKGIPSLAMALLVLLLCCNVTLASEHAKNPIVLYVLADRNITPDLYENVKKSQNELADWWEANLIEVLTEDGGYKAKLIKSKDEFVAGPDTYLLITKIVKYNPGSSAARFWVGFGVGYCSLDLLDEFFGADGKQIFSKKDYISSSIGWKKMAKKMNRNILDFIDKELKPAGK